MQIAIKSNLFTRTIDNMLSCYQDNKGTKMKRKFLLALLVVGTLTACAGQKSPCACNNWEPVQATARG